jgi:hypothetical protein
VKELDMATNSNDLSHCLSYVNKQFKWNCKLKEFVQTTLSLDGNWTSLNENTEKFTSHDGNVFITFYKSTGTLLIQGKEPYRTNLIELMKTIAMAE